MAWYPIEDRVLELLQPALAYAADRASFHKTWQHRLQEVGLSVKAGQQATEDVTEQLHQQQHFDWYSDNDSQTYNTYERMRFWQLVDHHIFAAWCEQIKPDTRLLDVGCAQGRSTFKVTAPHTTIVGFDISKRLVAQAVARARGRASMHFFVADATRMPIVDNSFDYLLIYGVLHHLPEPEQTCREAQRVLKDGGKLFCSENNITFLRPIFDWLQRRRPAWYEEAGEHSQMGRRELGKWLADAGLQARISTGVFVPPHLLNILPTQVGRALFELSDRVLTAIPWLRDQGGLIVSTSVK